MRQHMASCTGLSVLLVDALRAAGIPARFAGTPAWHDDRGNHSWVEVWIDGRWHFTEYYFPGRLDYAWFFADAGQASPDDRAHGIFAVSFRPAGDWFPMVWSEDSREVHGVNVTQRYRDLYAAYADDLAERGRHATVTFMMYDRRRMPGVPIARVAANVDVFCGSEQMGGGRTAGPRQDMNDALRFLLEKGRTYTFRYENSPRRSGAGDRRSGRCSADRYRLYGIAAGSGACARAGRQPICFRHNKTAEIFALPSCYYLGVSAGSVPRQLRFGPHPLGATRRLRLFFLRPRLALVRNRHRPGRSAGSGSARSAAAFRPATDGG